MRFLEIRGALGGEALATGEYVAVLPSGVQTDLGSMDAPLGLPLYPRVSKVPQFQFAGQAMVGTGTLVWNGQWLRDARTPTGVSGCIFDRAGVLHVIEPGPGVTSQGFRYVAPDGTLVLGDATFALRHGLNEWTDLSLAQDGSLLIGQGNPGGGVRVWDGAVLRELHLGHCTFVRANREGLDVAVTFLTPDALVIYWLTVEELRTLPPVSAPAPTPAPAPVPPMIETPNASADVAAVAAQFPHLLQANTHESIGEFTERVAFALSISDPNWGLVKKPEGRKAYNGHGLDAVKYKATGQVVDIVNGAGDETPTTVSWSHQPSRSDEPWMAAVPVSGAPVPAPVPAPAPTCDCKAELFALRDTVAALTNRVKQAELEAQEAAAEARHALDVAKAPRPLPTFRVRGATSRSWSHAHSVDLEVIPT